MKKILSILIFLAAIPAALAQAPPAQVAPVFKGKNVWSGDNFETVCTIAAVGSPGTFTPSCPSNNITITAAGQTIALPSIGTPAGQQPSSVTKSIELNIFYSGAFVPSFASGYAWVNGVAPVACTAGASGCLSGVVSSNPDIVECRSAGETLVRCGPPLTAMASTAPFSLIAHAQCAAASGCTTSAINTTGANLFVVAAVCYNQTPVATDSSSNSWSSAVNTSVTSEQISILYVYAPTTSTSHTFTQSACTDSHLQVQAWSGAIPSPLDQTNSHVSATSVSSLQPGSVTPSQSGELIVSALMWANVAGAASIDSGFTISDQGPWQSGVGQGGAEAYLVQGIAAAVNPTWTTPPSAAVAAAVIATFK